MAKILVQPLLIFVSLICGGLIVSRVGSRSLRRIGVAAVCIGAFLLAALSTPAVASLLCDSLEIPSGSADAPHYIVVLAGGYRAAASPDQDVLSSESMQRVLAGVHLWKQHPSARLIMTGTVSEGNRSPARITELMAEAATCHGVPAGAIIRETSARNTREHPLGVLRLPAMSPAANLAIVTSRIHERRATIEFRRYFAHVSSDPISERSPNRRFDWRDWIPQDDGLISSTGAVQEWIGILWYRILALRHPRAGV